MKRIGLVLLAVMFMSGCMFVHQEVTFEADVTVNGADAVADRSLITQDADADQNDPKGIDNIGSIEFSDILGLSGLLAPTGE